MPTIEDRLRLWQQELLDFSFRNTLLNFRYSTSRPSTVKLIAPGAPEIYSVLTQGKSLTILGTDPVSDEESDSEENSEDLAIELQWPEQSTDIEPHATAETDLPAVRSGCALTSLTSERANKVLLRLAARARGAELEQGINTLFAAFGLLKWQDPRDEKKWQFAPLILLPLRIEDVPRELRYRIAASDDEPELNQTLAEFLRRNLSIDLSIEIDEDTPLERILDQVREATAGRSGWEVLSEVHLGHFQFHKLRMYEDLTAHVSIAANHEVIQALGSDVMQIGPLPGGLPREEELDRLVPPEQAFSVLDADASQLQAVQASVRGSHLIIQGPPGTGKSQTIANIIAECIAAGRTVLFVSEKAAAIDVVHRRLEQQGLSDYCLPLHSHKANKRDIIVELGRQLDGNAPKAIDAKERLMLPRLQEQRLVLDDYAEALHRPRAPFQESIFQVQSELIQLRDVPLIAVDSISVSALTHEWLDQATSSIEELATHATVLAQAAEHPWAGVQVRTLSFTERDRLQNLLASVPRQIRHMLALGERLASSLGLRSPATIAAIETLCDIAGRIPEDGGLRANWFELQHAEAASTLLTEARTNAATLRELDARITATYEPGFFEISLDNAIMAYEQGMFARLFSSTYRTYRSHIRNVTRDRRNRAHNDELFVLRDARSHGQYRAWFDQNEPKLLFQLGLSALQAMQLSAPDWDRLAEDITRAAQISRLLSPQPAPSVLIANAGDRDRAYDVADKRRQTLTAIADYTAQMDDLAMFFENGLVPAGTGGDLESLARALQDRAGRLYELDQWLRAQLSLQSVRNAGLADVVQTLSQSQAQPSDWGRTFRRLALTQWLDLMLSAEPTLQLFDGNAHDRRVDQFRSLDRAALRLGSRRVRESWTQRRGPVSAAYGGEPGVLRFEAQKRRRHLPLRKLFERIPNLLPTLKPCLMMSPLSVAHYLPADRYKFDVVIFDEASQVRPHDAIGAIMRGRQIIVAGDSKQLPPTSFFERVTEDLGDEDDQDMIALESILDVLNAKGMPQTRLLWHYRSRHEDLIAYSNHHFYDGQLITFPSPGAGRLTTSGVHFEFVPDGRYVDERDKVLKTPIRINRVEARRVARLVMEHARTRPDESLLVVTLGMRQREVVEEEIAQARQLEQDLEDFFSRDKAEPFDVKALEQVQGDERDVIIVSVGYGKNADGVLSHRFGPINLEGGERRLNVLVTRARDQVVLVSSIRYTDIDPEKTRNLGPKLLRNYLEFAERGPVALGGIEVAPGGYDYESPFEEQVGEALRRAGYDVRCQVGTSNYRIDLAIVDPRDTNRFLLGVECDGRTYHQSKTARDRDRLRQEVLENLGWQIHRIWSTEWMRNPEHELHRVISRIDELLSSELPPPPPQENPDEESPVDARTLLHLESSNTSGQDEDDLLLKAVPVAAPICVAYQISDFTVPFTELWETPVSQVTQAVDRCVEIEGPIHKDLLQRRLATLWGHQRAGARIARRIEEATDLCVRRGLIRKQGSFLWPAIERELTPRGASDDGEVRVIAHVPEEEIALVLQAILTQAMSLTPDDLIQQTARVLGYQRVGQEIRARILTVARGLHKNGTINFRDGLVQVGR